jgi:hypothetical protein
MSEETHQVLEMLSQGKVSVLEAEQLLAAINSAAGAAGGSGADEKRPEPRYFRVLVNQPASEGKKAKTVNIRVPMSVVRGGLRLGAFLPGMLGGKKIRLENGGEFDLSKIDFMQLETMIKDLGELTVDVDGDAQMRIRCE